MNKTIFTIFVVITTLISGKTNAQIFDNYGVKIGVGLSNQDWQYKNIPHLESGWFDDKTSFELYLMAEKKLNKFSSLRLGLGYNEKGFIDPSMLNFSQPNLAYIIHNDKVKLHNLSASLDVKIFPFKTKLSPYFFAGFKGDYLLAYKDYDLTIDDNRGGPYRRVLSEFNKLVLSGLLGLGIQYNEITYLEFEVNPGLSKNIDNSNLSIKDRYYGIAMGLNISKLLQKNK